jgi:hypothetical protein
MCRVAVNILNKYQDRGGAGGLLLLLLLLQPPPPLPPPTSTTDDDYHGVYNDDADGRSLALEVPACTARSLHVYNDMRDLQQGKGKQWVRNVW